MLILTLRGCVCIRLRPCRSSVAGFLGLCWSVLLPKGPRRALCPALWWGRQGTERGRHLADVTLGGQGRTVRGTQASCLPGQDF